MSCAPRVSFGYPMPNSCGCGDGPLAPTPGRTVLWCPESPLDQQYSASFVVGIGMHAMIEVFNMPVGKSIFINRIVKATTMPRTCEPCDPCAAAIAFGTPGFIVFRQRMTLGGVEWKITPSTAQSIIPVPGMYELELENVNMLGDLEVDLIMYSARDVGHLPVNYFVGARI